MDSRPVEGVAAHGLLRNKNYMWLLAGTGLSGLGDQLYIFALPWLIYSLSGSALAMTGIRAAEFVPNILFGFVAGVFVDRWERRKVILWAAVVQAGILLTISLIPEHNPSSIVALWLLAFALNTVGFFGSIGLTSLIPQVVPPSQIAAANGQASLVGTLLRLLGPAVAGALVAAVGVRLGLQLDGLSFLAITAAALKVQLGRGVGGRRRTSVREANKEALRWLRGSLPLLYATIAVASLNFFHSSVIALVLYRARHDLNMSAATAGLIFTVGAVGNLIVAAVVSRTIHKVGWRSAFLGAFPILVFGCMVMGLASSPLGLAIGYAIDQAGVTLANTCYFTARQTLTPNDMLGRIASVTSMIMKLPNPVGVLVFGFIADRISGQAAFVAIAAGLFIASAACGRRILFQGSGPARISV